MPQIRTPLSEALASVAVVDDSDVVSRGLAALLEEAYGTRGWRLDGVARYASLAGFERALDGGRRFDLVFMDILFDDASDGGATGIDAVSRLGTRDRRMQVVYVSGYDSYHTGVYRTDHAGFLLKPVTAEKLRLALDCVADRMQARCGTPVDIHVGGKVRLVYPDDIRFVESDRRLLHIHSREGTIDAYLSLDGLLQRLPDRFVHCHKSYAVNVDCIATYSSDHLMLRGGERIPVSRSRRESTLARIADRFGM